MKFHEISYIIKVLMINIIYDYIKIILTNIQVINNLFYACLLFRYS
jgi:hypothetical protein